MEQRHLEIGRIQNLTSEIRYLRLDESNLHFRISDLRFWIRPISKFLRNLLVVYLCIVWTAHAAPQTPVRDFVTTYCVACHNDRLKTGGLSLERDDAMPETWEKVVVKLRSRSMPPRVNRRPD